MKQSLLSLALLATLATLFAPHAHAMRGPEFKPPVAIYEQPEKRPIIKERNSFGALNGSKNTQLEKFDSFVREFKKDHTLSQKIELVCQSLVQGELEPIKKFIHTCSQEELLEFLTFCDFLDMAASVSSSLGKIIVKKLPKDFNFLAENANILKNFETKRLSSFAGQILGQLCCKALKANEKVTLSKEQVKIFTKLPEQLKFKLRKKGVVDISSTSKATELMLQFVKGLAKKLNPETLNKLLSFFSIEIPLFAGLLKANPPQLMFLFTSVGISLIADPSGIWANSKKICGPQAVAFFELNIGAKFCLWKALMNNTGGYALTELLSICNAMALYCLTYSLDKTANDLLNDLKKIESEFK